MISAFDEMLEEYSQRENLVRIVQAFHSFNITIQLVFSSLFWSQLIIFVTQASNNEALVANDSAEADLDVYFNDSVSFGSLSYLTETIVSAVSRT